MKHDTSDTIAQRDAADVIDVLRDGDKKAFNRLQRRYYPLVNAVARKIYNDPSYADEVSQNTFLIAFEKLPTLKDPKFFAAWLRKLALHEAIRYSKELSAQRNNVAYDEGICYEKDPYLEALPSNDIRDEFEDQIRKLVKSLSDGHCLLLDLFYLRGLSQEQIANFLGVPVGTIKRRLFDTREKLKLRSPLTDDILGNRESVGMLLDEVHRSVIKHKKEKLMKIALLGDIHGNLEALTAVVKELKKEKPDRIIITGDIVGYGANPHECLETVQSLNAELIAGNFELALNDDTFIAGFQERAKASIYWTRALFNKKEKEMLAALPRRIAINDVEIVHGTPPDDSMKYVMSADEVKEAFKRSTASVIFAAHTHCPIAVFSEEPLSFTKETSFNVPVGLRAFVNVGSVGQPRDSDTRACYCIYNTETRKVELRRCEYDIKTAAQKIRDAGLPPMLADRLFTGK